MIFIPDIIKEIVDSMREVGTFSLPTNNSDGTFTVSTKNNLKPLEWIEISGVEYKIIERTDNDFKIASPTVIVAGGYKALAPYYLYGHRLDINRRLLEKNKDSIFKYQKYPLIVLRLPLSQTVNNTMVNEIMGNMAIFGFTDKNYTSEQRYIEVIKPVLSPLYEKLLVALENSSYISGLGATTHKRVDRLFWGVETKEGNTEYLFTDPLDAIELIDLKLKVLDLNCI